MKKVLTIIRFEFLNYVKNKSFMITTILLSVLFVIAMFLPKIFDMSELLGTKKQETIFGGEIFTGEQSDRNLALYDTTSMIKDITMLEEAFPDVKWVICESEKEVEDKVKDESCEAGFVVKTNNAYDYYVLNKSMSSSDSYVFHDVMTVLYRQAYCEQHGIEYTTFVAEYEAPITSNEKILGKDAASNYWYCYVLVMIVFIVVIMYGTMIATSVTNEKSNRCIEVLVTSVNSSYLLFGKVIAGTIASVFQIGLIMAAALVGYQVNREAWGNVLDIVLDIPSDVLLAFTLFGVAGFMFYAFLYGAMGALVSKTEDLNKSTGGLQAVIMVVYLATFFFMDQIDGVVMKIFSYLPFSSYSAMFIRIGMGSVETWEIVLSFVILVVSVVATGFIGAGIYRLGTLRYGNPIKVTNVLKTLWKKG